MSLVNSRKNLVNLLILFVGGYITIVLIGWLKFPNNNPGFKRPQRGRFALLVSDNVAFCKMLKRVKFSLLKC